SPRRVAAPRATATRSSPASFATRGGPSGPSLSGATRRSSRKPRSGRSGSSSRSGPRSSSMRSTARNSTSNRFGWSRTATAPTGQPTKDTVPGELFGHLFLAYDMSRTAAAGVPDLNPELLELLLHCVVTHLKLPEWGSPRLPCIPEVLILHRADDLDAKMEMYVRCLTRDTAEGPFTDRDPVLGRPLFKGRK